MKALNTEISIGDYQFNYVNQAEVESTWELLTDTCEITVPRKLSFDGKAIVQGESLFKRGDQVTVKSGYDGVLNTLFTGYVSAIKPGTNLIFMCEDAMWKLKQQTITRSYKEVTLKQLLADICPIGFEVPDVNLGQFRISHATPAQVLEELRKTYGLQSFVRDGVLYSGLAYWPSDQQSSVFRYQYNIIDDDLEYQRIDDVQIKVRAVSMLEDNTKLEVEVGDPDGDLRTLTFYNLNEADLKETAEREAERLRYEGYRGSFETFGEPFVRHGDIAIIQDPTYPDREGSYLIKKVVYSTGVSGYRQNIFLDRKIS